TQDDTAMGTMSYMAPEQFRDAASVTVSADIYSLGSMLYELLAGEVPIPYKGDITSFSDKVENFDPLPPQRRDRSVSKDIQNVCLKCLAKKPEQRYGSAAELTDDLTAFLEGRPVSARRVGPLGQSWRICMRYPKTASLAGLFVMALLVGFLVSVKFMIDAQHQANLALGAVNQFYLQIDQNDAFRQPAFNALRVRLMKEGRDRLEELTYAPVSSRDKSNQRAIATLHFVNGRSLQESEQSASAFSEFQLAASIQLRLSVNDPDDLDSKADLAMTLVAMEKINPQHEGAPFWRDQAQTLREEVAERLHDDDIRKPKALRLLANIFMNEANRLAEPMIQRRVEATPETVKEALQLFQLAGAKRDQATGLLPSLDVDQGEKDALARDIIVGKANLAVLLSQLKERSPDAVAALHDATRALSEYLKTHAWDVEARRQFAECQLSKYLIADVKTDTEFTAMAEAERDADVVMAMIPNDMYSRRTVARIALERALERIVSDLDFAIESNVVAFTPARLNAAAVEQLSRAFEHLPADPEGDKRDANINDSEFLTAVRLARVLQILTPLEGVTVSADADPDDSRKKYLTQLQTTRQHLYQPPPDALAITPNDFHESQIQVLAYSAVVAHLQFETSKRDAKARECLAAITSRRNLGQECDSFLRCETIARQILQLTSSEQQ
ncbi:MAG: protein kinase, partial [Planctomycetota bacterium]|nr:protein kinase [Planctomycetota bacterium]